MRWFFWSSVESKPTIIRIQLIVPHNDFVSPQVFNRMFTMHGTTMIFFVAMPVLFGFANYLMPLMIGARDMAFPRLNAFSFWMTAFGGLLLYSVWWEQTGSTGRAMLPTWDGLPMRRLTSHDVFARSQHRFLDPGSTGLWLRQHWHGHQYRGHHSLYAVPGNDTEKMPLFAWLNLVMAALVVLATQPLTAAQIMLLVDRYLGGHFFDTQAGGSAVIWMHFFWIFGHPEVYVLVIPAFAFIVRNRPSIFPQAYLRLSGDGRSHSAIGFISMSVWAHHMFTVGMGADANTFFVLSTMAIAVPTGIKIFNWLGDHVGREDSVQDADAVLRSVFSSNS